MPPHQSKQAHLISCPKIINQYADMGIDIKRYSDWWQLQDDLIRTNRWKGVPGTLTNEQMQARVKYADSKVLALRAFLHNVFDYLNNPSH